MPSNKIHADALRDELARRARRRGLAPCDLAAATNYEVATLHITRWFAGQQSMVSTKVSLLAAILGLRWTDDVWTPER